MATGRKTFAAIALALTMISGSALAFTIEKPPTDEEVSAAVAKYNELIRDRRGDREGTMAAAEEALGDLDISSMSAEQFARFPRFGLPQDMSREAYDRLTELSKDKGVEGAKASVIRLNFIPTPATAEMEEEARAAAIEQYRESRQKAVVDAIRHPGMFEALRQGEATDIFSQVGTLSAAKDAKTREALLSLEQALTPELPASVVGRGTGYFQVLLSEDLAIGEADRERIRTKLLGLAEEKLATLSKEDEAARRGLESTRDFLGGAFARGELVDHQAPELEILWSSDPAITSLASLKGKVVVLDFWATWCGPCIASFPQVRELVAHYEGYPVAVIGVTSVQGRHYAKDRTVTETKDDPSKEFELMSGYLPEMEITWPVVFSKQNVFNPDYGVRGIPHVAILDPDGIVRYRGLHPARPLAEKTEKIDALLKKAGLPTPPPVEPSEEDGK